MFSSSWAENNIRPRGWWEGLSIWHSTFFIISFQEHFYCNLQSSPVTFTNIRKVMHFHHVPRGPCQFKAHQLSVYVQQSHSSLYAALEALSWGAVVLWTKHTERQWFRGIIVCGLSISSPSFQLRNMPLSRQM